MSDKNYEEFSDENNSYYYWDLYKGILYSFLSGFFSSLSSVIVKYLDDIHPGELAVFRYIAILLLTLPMVIRNGSNPFGPPELRHILILRGISGATAVYLLNFAFRYLPIADVTVIIFSTPVFVSIFACVFLKESCGVFETLTVLLTGLSLTTKLTTTFGSNEETNINSLLVDSTTNSILNNMPINMDSTKEFSTSENSHQIYGVLSALLALLFASGTFIFIRKTKSVHYSVIMFNYVWVAIVETVILTALMDGFSMPKTLTEWPLIILLGISSFYSDFLLTLALLMEQAGPVSVVRAATEIVLAFVWQLWLFNDIPDFWSIIGALLVTVCVLITSARKWILALPEDSGIKSI